MACARLIGNNANVPIDQLPDFGLLAGVPPADRERLLAIARRRDYDKGEVVFTAGAAADSLHLVARGRFSVRSDSPAGDTAMLSILGAGAFFGELALVAPERRRTATVVAIERAATLVIGASGFEQLREHHPSVNRVLVGALGLRVNDLTQRLVEALYTPVEARVCARLVEAAEQWGGRTIPLTQQDLAELAGTTRPTANRLLRQAEREGMIELARARIRILDLDALRDRAEQR